VRVGILGVGVHLPPEVRHNDFWSADVVARWRALPRPPLLAPRAETPLAAKVLAALEHQAPDPFQGTVARRILAPERGVVDMEEAAARSALASAGVEPGDVDLLLTHSAAPDVQVGNAACVLHHRLGLPPACVSLQTEASSHAFMLQLRLAEAMLRSGQARHAVLVQSSVASRLVDVGSPMAPIFGDAATAVVLGPVAADRGLEGSVTFTDGRHPRTLLASVPGKRWYEEGRAVLHVADAAQARDVFLLAPDQMCQSIEAVLAQTGVIRQEIDFLALHQGAAWLRGLVAEGAGLSHTRSVETFRHTGYVFAATLPIALGMAVVDGALLDGDRVLLVGGGPGTTYGATLLRWGH
jgi:3-oxoacyl-[acyl-carrier-protein] synthase III